MASTLEPPGTESPRMALPHQEVSNFLAFPPAENPTWTLNKSIFAELTPVTNSTPGGIATYGYDSEVSTFREGNIPVDCSHLPEQFATYTIRKQPDPKDSLGTWAKAQFIREPLAQDDIAKHAKLLNEKTKSVPEKKAKLFPFQQQQVTKFFGNQINQETDKFLEWSERPFDREEKNSKQGQPDSMEKPQNHISGNLARGFLSGHDVERHDPTGDAVQPSIGAESGNIQTTPLWHIQIDKGTIMAPNPSYNKLITDASKSELGEFANTFVLKTYFTSETEKYFDPEVAAFRHLESTPSIIKFYGSFTRNETCNVLLEYTDKGTLEDYFKNEAPPTSIVAWSRDTYGYHCLFPGCKRKQDFFKRLDDGCRRHIQVHINEAQKGASYYTYERCERSEDEETKSFRKELKDYCRDHLMGFHKEDLPGKRSILAHSMWKQLEERKGEKSWWDCGRCSEKAHRTKDGISHPCYTPYLDIDGDSAPARHSENDAATPHSLLKKKDKGNSEEPPLLWSLMFTQFWLRATKLLAKQLRARGLDGTRCPWRQLIIKIM